MNMLGNEWTTKAVMQQLKMRQKEGKTGFVTQSEGAARYLSESLPEEAERIIDEAEVIMGAERESEGMMPARWQTLLAAFALSGDPRPVSVVAGEMLRCETDDHGAVGATGAMGGNILTKANELEDALMHIIDFLVEADELKPGEFAHLIRLFHGLGERYYQACRSGEADIRCMVGLLGIAVMFPEFLLSGEWLDEAVESIQFFCGCQFDPGWFTAWWRTVQTQPDDDRSLSCVSACQ